MTPHLQPPELPVQRAALLLLPPGGSILFGVLYFVASTFYPGGSQLSSESRGYGWIHNYWCNLLNETAINGMPNEARPIAMWALVVLALSLLLFWYLFPLYVPFKTRERRTVQVCGFLCMFIGLFHFTPFHDTIINVAGLFGLVAILGTLAGLRRLGWGALFRCGLLVIVLIAMNNLLYYGPGGMYYLPLVQKITFALFLVWTGSICICLYVSARSSACVRPTPGPTRFGM